MCSVVCLKLPYCGLAAACSLGTAPLVTVNTINVTAKVKGEKALPHILIPKHIFWERWGKSRGKINDNKDIAAPPPPRWDYEWRSWANNQGMFLLSLFNRAI